MPTLTVKPKRPKNDVPAAELAWLRDMARSRGCDSLLLHLAPADGAAVSVHWEEVE